MNVIYIIGIKPFISKIISTNPRSAQSYTAPTNITGAGAVYAIKAGGYIRDHR